MSRRKRNHQTRMPAVSSKAPAGIPSTRLQSDPKVQGYVDRIPIDIAAINKASLMALQGNFTASDAIDFGTPKSPNWINRLSIKQLKGRPVSNSEVRQTMPTRDFERNHGGSGNRIIAEWDNAPYAVKRPELPLYSFQNLKWTAQDLPRASERLTLISPDMAFAKHQIKRLCNTKLNPSAKTVPDDGTEAVEEDPIATQIVKEALATVHQQVASDIPDAMGGIVNFNDLCIESLLDYGEVGVEAVPNPSRTKIVNVVYTHPFTVEVRRDPDRPGMFLLGQLRADVKGGWKLLNPNLFSFVTTNGEIYGVSEFVTAAHVIPLWMGYFGKLQIFLHRAAFGFLDAVIKTDTLKEMWDLVEQPISDLYGGDFMTWANAMVAYVAESYKNQGEIDPDGIIAHLDLMEIKAEAAGKASFPMPEAKNVMKQEVYASLKTPGELLGEPSTSNDKFTMMKIRAYHEYLKFLQGKLLKIYNRIGTAALLMAGYTNKVEVCCYFDEIRMDDELTQVQARQLWDLVWFKRRDENIVSQNVVSRHLVGGPAIGPAPLSDGADPNGASAPSVDIMLQRQAGSDSGSSSGGNGAASGTANRTGGSYGGKNKQRDSTTNQQKDKKMILEEWDALSADEKREKIQEMLIILTENPNQLVI